EKVEGLQQQLFVAGRELTPELLDLERTSREDTLRNTSAGPVLPAAASGAQWLRQLHGAARDILEVVPRDRVLILVDDNTWGSPPNAIPTIVHLVRQLQPRSILDVGVGFGKWGHLFREYTDILEAEHEPSRYDRENWQVRIEGIEGHAAYLTPMHHFLYDQIHV